jgi:hypothetical protein
MKFEIIYSLSKNKANVGDKYKIDDGNREVTKITKRYVYLDNKNYFPVKMFNTWMRISLDMQTRDENSLVRKMKIKHREREIAIMRKEVKAEYDEKWRTKGVNHLGRNTQLLPYIVLTGVGDTVKFYFSPTTKSDFEDLELSYKSLHGVAYKAFAYGHYIKHYNNYALIGMYPFNNSNLSDKRKRFAMYCINKEQEELPDGNKIKVNAMLYADMVKLFKDSELLSSESESSKPQPQSEQKHWSGLNGDIATSQIDQAINDMLAPEEDDFPF